MSRQNPNAPESFVLATVCLLLAFATPLRGLAEDMALPAAALETVDQRVRWISNDMVDAPVPHRRLHGELVGTQTRFNLLLPLPEKFRGLLMQHLQGGIGGDEFHGQRRGDHHVALQEGAVFLESNQGHVGADMSGLGGDPSVLEWRASVETATLARQFVASYYDTDPPQLIVEGGSAGGMRTIACMQNAPQLYAGGLAYMINRTDLTPFNWSVTVWASHLLMDDMEVLAHDPAGFLSKATDREKHVLATLYRAGFPRGAESQLGYNPLWAMAVQHVGAQDPDYFRAFWEDSDYSSVRATAPTPTEQHFRVRRIVTAGELRTLAADPSTGADELHESLLAAAPEDLPMGIVLDGQSNARALAGYELQIENGPVFVSTGGVGATVTAILSANAFDDVSVGDRITVSNRKLIAFSHYHRFATQPGYAGMRQFWVDGKPLPGQRPQPQQNLSPIGAGKLMVMQHLMDREAWPTVAEQFFTDLERNSNPTLMQHTRLYWTQAAQHSPTLDAAGPAQFINYRGIIDQGRIDLMAWVKNSILPRADTSYSLRQDGELALLAPHNESEGLQPALTLEANEADTERRQEGALNLTLKATATARSGDSLESLEFDPLGDGSWTTLWTGRSGQIIHQWHHIYAPGETGRATVRVTAVRDGQQVRIPLQNIATAPVGALSASSANTIPASTAMARTRTEETR